jgi:hypothetical protein
MEVVAARFEVARDGELREDRRSVRIGHLELADAVEVAPRGDPAGPVSRRQVLREGGAEEHVSLGVAGLDEARPPLGKIELPVDVVLDEGHSPARQHGREVDLGLVGHAAPQRVVEVGHRHDCLDRMVLQGELEGVEAHPRARVGRDLEGLEVQGLEDEEDAEVGGRLDGHRVPGRADGLEAEGHGLAAARGDDHVVRPHLAAVAEGPLRYLHAELLAAFRDRGGVLGEPALARELGQEAVEPCGGQELGVGRGRAELREVGIVLVAD